jgi:hypothetical protein
MPRDDTAGQGKSKPEMIRSVLEADADMAATTVQAAVWEQFGGEVTAREIAAERKKLRQVEAPPAETPRPPKPRAAERRDRPKAVAGPRKKSAAGSVRAKDFGAADVTVKQLSAILEVANDVGGLRRLGDAVATVARLREKAGHMDERQLAYALDFLTRLTGRK